MHPVNQRLPNFLRMANPDLDVYTKFGKILSISSQNILPDMPQANCICFLLLSITYFSGTVPQHFEDMGHLSALKKNSW